MLAALDRTKLGIAKGQQCWVVYIDCMVLDYAGNVCDAAAIAVKVCVPKEIGLGVKKVESGRADLCGCHS
tara:strand:- start:1178 stop:1387 length:210 start_codon:yes stop_codon:yes gene_type:complete